MSGIDRIRRSTVGRRIESAMRFPRLCLLAMGETNTGFWRPGWKTVDLVDADYLCDLRKDRLPFADNSVDMVYCSHVVEHLPFPDTSSHLFGEVWRVLKPSGVFRVVTPDAELLLARYRAGDWSFFLKADGRFILDRIMTGQISPESLLMHNRLVGWFASYSGRLDTGGGPITSKDLVDRQIESLDIEAFGRWCVSLLEPHRVYAHVNVYHGQRLRKELVAAGFAKVEKSGFNVSKCPRVSRFHMDREYQHHFSLYMEAVKT